jgi:hypothetical protein
MMNIILRFPTATHGGDIQFITGRNEARAAQHMTRHNIQPGCRHSGLFDKIPTANGLSGGRFLYFFHTELFEL